MSKSKLLVYIIQVTVALTYLTSIAKHITLRNNSLDSLSPNIKGHISHLQSVDSVPQVCGENEP